MRYTDVSLPLLKFDSNLGNWSPWYYCAGWQGVKHQLTYLLGNCSELRSCVKVKVDVLVDCFSLLCERKATLNSNLGNCSLTMLVLRGRKMSDLRGLPPRASGAAWFRGHSGAEQEGCWLDEAGQSRRCTVHETDPQSGPAGGAASCRCQGGRSK